MTSSQQSHRFVAIIGFFDGVHLGHQYLIEELKQLAKAQGKKSMLITFAAPPRKILQPEFIPQLLTSFSERISFLEQKELDACVVLNFTKEMAQISAFDFMKQILKEQYGVETLLIGHDHRFGRNREEGFSHYLKYGKELGIELIKAKQFAVDSYPEISSSQIRKELQEGNVSQANKMLGYDFSFRGRVVGGFKLGRKIGFPTANVEPEDSEKIIPKQGVYVVCADLEDKKYFGMLNIGIRPTLQNDEKISIEVNLFDFNKDIYGQEIRIFFLERIRDERKFENVEKLIEQLKKDKLKALRIIESLQKK